MRNVWLTDKEVDELCKKFRSTMDKLYNSRKLNQNFANSFHENYDLVYRCCISKYHLKIYQEISNFLTAQLKKIFADAASLTSSEKIFNYTAKHWKSFQIFLKLLNDVCMYLNGCSNKNKLKTIYKLGIDCWQEEFTNANGLNQHVSNVLLNCIQEKLKYSETLGEAGSDTYNLIENALKCFGIEKDCVEFTFKAYAQAIQLAQTELVLLKNCTSTTTSIIANFKSMLELFKNLKLIQTECTSKLVPNPLPEFLLSQIRQIYETALFADDRLATTEKVFTSFLLLLPQQLKTDESKKVLKLLNELFKEVSTTPPLLIWFQNSLEEHIYQQGTGALANLSNSDQQISEEYVNAILQVHRQFSILDKCENKYIDAVKDKAFRRFINCNAVTTKKSSVAELVAQFCDLSLRKIAECLNPSQETSQTFENILNQVITVFQYITDKEPFEQLYHRMLLKRMIKLEKSFIEVAETNMISKLKQTGDLFDPAKLERTLQSGTENRKLNEQMMKEKENSKDPLPIADFSVQVFNCLVWPYQKELSTTTSFVLPEELKNCVSRFTLLYNGQFSKRKLHWQMDMSLGELNVVVSSDQKPTTLKATTFQMAVLLAYNTTDKFIVRQLYERTKIARNKLIQVLTSLLKAKLLVVVTEKVISDNCEKESRAKEVKSNWPVLNLNSVLSLNLSAIKGRRNVNISKHYSNSSSQKIVEKTIEADQKLAIQAAIVRILKGSRSLAHQQLFTEVTLQLMSRFTPKEATVQQCIRILIDKEYIRSTQKSSSSASASNPHTIFYQYLE